MTEYTQGIYDGQPAILKNGEPVTIDELIEDINKLQEDLYIVQEYVEGLRREKERALNELSAAFESGFRQGFEGREFTNELD
jgi:hypothetical protein